MLAADAGSLYPIDMMWIRAVLVAGCCASPAIAQDKPNFDISANARLRYEAIGGQARIGVPVNEDLVNLRTIVRAQYHTGPVTIGVDLADSRVLGAGTPSAISINEVNALEPIQAYVAADFTAPAGIKAHATLGRMAFELGSARLIANDEYRNTANSFTGIKLDLRGPERLSTTMLYVLPQQRRPDDQAGLRSARPALDREGFDTRLWGGYVARSRAIGPVDLDATVLRFEERDRPGRPTRDRRLTTLAARASIPPRPGRVDLDVELIRQTGRTRTGLAATAPRQAVNAWFVHAEAGYKLANGWRPHLSIEGDYASGDDHDPDFGRFDTLFGQRRRDFSPAGLLSSIGRRNILSVGARLELTPSRRIEGFGAVRKLWLASRMDDFATTGVIDPSGRSGRDAGWEIDSRIRYWLVPNHLQFEGDYVLIAKGRFLREAPNRPTARNTQYLSLNMTAFF